MLQRNTVTRETTLACNKPTRRLNQRGLLTGASRGTVTVWGDGKHWTIPSLSFCCIADFCVSIWLIYTALFVTKSGQSCWREIIRALWGEPTATMETGVLQLQVRSCGTAFQLNYDKLTLGFNDLRGYQKHFCSGVEIATHCDWLLKPRLISFLTYLLTYLYSRIVSRVIVSRGKTIDFGIASAAMWEISLKCGEEMPDAAARLGSTARQHELSCQPRAKK